MRRLQTKTLSVLALGLAIMSSANSAVKSIGEPNYKWSKRNLRVCFDFHSPEQNSLTAELKEIVTREYSAEKTGIYFTGWKICSAETDPAGIDVRIEAPTSFRYAGLTTPAIGYDGFQTEGEATLHREKKTGPSVLQINLDYYLAEPSKGDDPFAGIKVTLLHELGHVAGLRHEHAYPDEKYKSDSSCWYDPGQEKIGTATVYGNYDPQSIMSYCLPSIIGHLGERLYFDPKALRGTDPNYVFGKYRTIPFLPQISDPKLVRISWDESAKLKRIDLRIGLSDGDRAALKKLYP